MNEIQLKKFVNSLQTGSQRELVIRINSNNFQKSLSRSRKMIEKIERNMRIQKLELALRKLNLQRAWV
jgi:hypothetical protein